MRSDRCLVRRKNFALPSFVGLLGKWRGMSGDAHDSDFAREVLPGGDFAVATAVLPICSDLFPIRARCDRAIWRNQRNGHGDLATASLSAVLRGWLRSGEVKLCQKRER